VREALFDDLEDVEEFDDDAPREGDDAAANEDLPRVSARCGSLYGRSDPEDVRPP
jgi:hypothetical protein